MVDEERFTEIERENRILFEKIVKIRLQGLQGQTNGSSSAETSRSRNNKTCAINFGADSLFINNNDLSIQSQIQIKNSQERKRK